MELRSRLLNYWDNLTSSYWFVPTIMAVGAIALSVATLWLDRYLAGEGLILSAWLYTGSAEGARSVPATIASSMVGIAGVVFSITTVTLTLAANQFGPRILRNFMADTGNQVVLGTFVATFLYCLLILRQTHGGAEGQDYTRFIPQISMLIAVLFAVASLGVLIYFIHHVAASIQPPNVAARIARDLDGTVDALYPETLGQAPQEAGTHGAELRGQMPAHFDAQAMPVRATVAGYIRQIESDDVLDLATSHDLIVRIEQHPGDFVNTGDTLMHTWPAERASEVNGQFRRLCVIGTQRTPTQDVRFPIGQLVEMAVIALSPGINDPFTAMMCIDRLGAALSQVAGRRLPSAFRADDAGRLRVIAEPLNFSQLLDESFDQIRHNARGHPAVMARLLTTLSAITRRISRPEDRQALLHHARLIHEQALANTPTDHDRSDIERRFATLREALQPGD